MQKSLLSVLALGSAFAVVAACSSKPPPPPMTPPVGFDAGAPDDAGALEEAGAPDAGGPVFFTDTDAGAAAPPVTTEAAFDATIDLAITTAAPKVAPKMEKEGAPGRATLPEGQHFSMMVNLAPNRCYTVVASSPPGQVEKLEVKLFGPPLFNIEAGKSSPSDKNSAVLGKGAAALCPIIPLAVPYKIDVAAVKGSGRIGVQVFARNK